jgi:hypothetical protein
MSTIRTILMAAGFALLSWQASAHAFLKTAKPRLAAR